MDIASLLTGVALLYRAARHESRAARSWAVPVGGALCAFGSLRAVAGQGWGPGVASALVLSMAATSVLALGLPLAPRAGWSLVQGALAGLWLRAVAGLW